MYYSIYHLHFNSVSKNKKGAEKDKKGNKDKYAYIHRHTGKHIVASVL